MKTEPDKGLFRGGLMPAGAPEGLKERVLSAARAAAAGGSPRRSLAFRIWENRRLRAGWALAVALLIAGHVYLASQQPPSSTPLRVLPIQREVGDEGQMLRQISMIAPVPMRTRAEELRALEHGLEELERNVRELSRGEGDGS